MNINTLLKRSNNIRFVDDEIFNADISDCNSLSDIKDRFSIRGKLRKLAQYGNSYCYGFSSYGYNFTIIFVD